MLLIVLLYSLELLILVFFQWIFFDGFLSHLSFPYLHFPCEKD